MAIVLIQLPSVNPTPIIQLPSVNPTPIVRPKECPYCGSEILQRWGAAQKPLRDTDFEQVQAYRFRCTGCARTFRHYPEGVDKADMSQRLRCLAALAWSMGLSMWGVGICGEWASSSLSLEKD